MTTSYKQTIENSSEALGKETPTNYRVELERRYRLARLCSENPKFLAAELEMCRRDPVHMTNNWGWTFDPREVPANLPFRLFRKQEQLMRWIEDQYLGRKHGVVEKSRDMGGSWVFIAWMVHGARFREGFFVRLGSRKEELVDDGTEESLFGKIRYFYYRLPWFLQIPNFLQRFHDTHLNFENTHPGNRIVGESANLDFGRGGRSSVTLLDEGASIAKSEQVWASISQNSNSVFWLSSPKGRNNAFYRLGYKAKLPKFTLHWTDDPRKDEAWYEKKKEELLPWQVGQELDLSYDQETGDKIYSRFERRWHVAPENIEFCPDYEQWVSWDFGRAGAMAMVWFQIAPNQIQVYNYFEFSGYDIDFFIPIRRKRLPAEFPRLTREQKIFVKERLDKVPNPTAAPMSFDCGDHAGVARTANSKRSCRDALEDAGFDLKTSTKQTYDYRFKCFDNLLRLRPVDPLRNIWRSRFVISPDCQRVIDCLNNYVNEDRAQEKGEIQPKINWASHIVTALEFFAINRFPMESNKPGYMEERIR